MNRNETILVLGTLQTAYPSFNRGLSREQVEATIRLWNEQFADVDYQTVSAAVRAIIATWTNTFPPTIGIVNDMVQKLSKPSLTEIEAWSYVRKALRNGVYGSKEEWERLPEIVKKAITPEQIRAWAMDDGFNESVASSNFMRSFSKIQQNQREYEMLPTDIQKLVRLAVPEEQKVISDTQRPMIQKDDEPYEPKNGELRDRLKECRAKVLEHGVETA